MVPVNGLVQLLIMVLIVLGAMAILAVRRPVFAKMSLRNIVRRKRYSAIVVAGLMIATAMISGSLVVGDTLDHLIKQAVYEADGEVDIVISVEDAMGDTVFFNRTVADGLVTAMGAGDMPDVDGVGPAIRERVSAVNPRLNSSSPTASLFAYDPAESVNDLLYESGQAVAAEDISGGRAVINQMLADELDAVAGDTLVVITDLGLPVVLVVSAVAKDVGKATWHGDQTVFVDLSYAQENMFSTPGMINRIDVSNQGGVEDGYIVTDQAVEELTVALPDGDTYSFDEVKKDGIESAQTASDQVSQIFIVMSSFAIIAGVALIINIFVMLAEERKPEMGISRAIGMQRGHLTQTFMLEGVVYALLASVIGAFAGLLIAAVMMALFSSIVAGQGLEFTFSFQWDSLWIAACAGFLITVLTVAVASWRVSKLNIVRAIKNIPEPILAKSGSKYLLTGLLAMFIGVLVTMLGDASDQASAISSGPCIMAFGAALVAVKYVSPRIPFTLTGLFMISWTVDPFNLDLAGRIFGPAEGNMEMFIVIGVLLVTGGVLVIMFNSDILLSGLMRFFGRKRSLLPVFKAAISYPMNKKFRTALTLFIFSLIMFTVVVVMMIASFQRESVDSMTQSYSGGFDIIGFTFRDVPTDELDQGLAEIDAAAGTQVFSRAEHSLTTSVLVDAPRENGTHATNLIGYGSAMLSGGSFSLAERSANYSSDEAAWGALIVNDDLAIMDGSVLSSMFSVGGSSMDVGLGDEVTIIRSDGGQANVTIIGIMDQMFVQGVFMSSEFVQAFDPAATQSLFYFSLADGVDMTVADAADKLERMFVDYGMVTLAVRDTVELIMQMTANVMQLMEIFLGVGLIVGVAGLGIITIRNVAERRQEIGVMRAIGYQRDMIMNVFVIETSFVSLLGILLGIVLGLGLSYRMWSWGGFSDSAPFVVPWLELLIVVAIAFAVTQASTLPPSRRASRLAPAEALRRVD